MNCAKTGFEYCDLTCGFETLRIDAVEYNSNEPESEEDGIEYVFSVDEIEIEKIVAFENELFSFDIEMPDEDFGIITYSLVSGPHGMSVDPVTGLINWTPDHTQIGENIVMRLSQNADMLISTWLMFRITSLKTILHGL